MNHDSFRRAILDTPEDDTPRLIYADWLEENGQPQRAQLIRVQCALAPLGADDPRRGALEAEERALLAAHRGDWLAELPSWAAPEQATFARGFVRWMTLTENRLLNRAEQLFAVTPLEGVRLRRVTRSLAPLAGSPHLARLRSLDLTRNVIQDSGVMALAASPQAANLTELVLDDNYVWSPGARAVVTSPHLSRLTSLSLRRTQMDNGGVRGLVEQPHACRLTALNLHDNRLSDAGLAALANSPYLGQ